MQSGSFSGLGVGGQASVAGRELERLDGIVRVDIAFRASGKWCYPSNRNNAVPVRRRLVALGPRGLGCVYTVQIRMEHIGIRSFDARHF